MNGKIEQLEHDCNVDYIKARQTITIKKGTPIMCILKLTLVTYTPCRFSKALARYGNRKISTL